jgi:hypothetical protein
MVCCGYSVHSYWSQKFLSSVLKTGPPPVPKGSETGTRQTHSGARVYQHHTRTQATASERGLQHGDGQRKRALRGDAAGRGRRGDGRGHRGFLHPRGGGAAPTKAGCCKRARGGQTIEDGAVNAAVAGEGDVRAQPDERGAGPDQHEAGVLGQGAGARPPASTPLAPRRDAKARDQAEAGGRVAWT